MAYALRLKYRFLLNTLNETVFKTGRLFTPSLPVYYLLQKKTDAKHAGLFVWFNVNFALN